jgi:hypothetical protein
VYANQIGSEEVPPEESEKEKNHILKLASQLVDSEVPLYQ